MKTIDKKGFKALNESKKTATDAMLSTLCSLWYACKLTNDLKSVVPEAKKWARQYDVKKSDICPENAVAGWLKKHTDNTTCIEFTPIYEINEDCSFVYYETTNSAGRKVYKKNVLFYVADKKTKWTVRDIMNSLCNCIKDKKSILDYTTMEWETPYVKDEKGKFVASNDKIFKHRALNETREYEAEQRAMNMEDAMEDAE